MKLQYSFQLPLLITFLLYVQGKFHIKFICFLFRYQIIYFFICRYRIEFDIIYIRNYQIFSIEHVYFIRKPCLHLFTCSLIFYVHYHIMLFPPLFFGNKTWLVHYSSTLHYLNNIIVMVF